MLRNDEVLMSSMNVGKISLAFCSPQKMDGLVTLYVDNHRQHCGMFKYSDSTSEVVQASTRKGADIAVWVYIRFKLMPFIAQMAFTLFNVIAAAIFLGVLYLLFT